MKKYFKFLLLTLATVLLFIIGFYFWASSSNLKEKEYAKVISNTYNTEINTDSVFSIITYNIGYLSGMTNNLPIDKPKYLFQNNLKTILKELKKVNADIIAFQEIDFDSNRSYNINQQNEIAKLGYNYIGETINWDKKYVPFPEFPISMHFGKIISGQSVLSKFEIIEQKRIELARNNTNPFYYNAFYLDRLAQIVKIKIPDNTLIIINVHLEAFHQETRKIQTKKIIELFNFFAQNFPTILLGDFNSDPSNKNSTIKAILQIPNIGNSAFSADNYSKTFNSKNPSERLDYIFYNKNFVTFIDGKVLSSFKQASDHLPLFMNFKIKKQNE